MSNNEKVKYSIYITAEVVEAIKNIAHAKKVSAGYVIEAAIKKCVPEKYFPESGA